jgi:hypothetical protein
MELKNEKKKKNHVNDACPTVALNAKLIVAEPPQNSVQHRVAVPHHATQPTQACSVISFFDCK